MLMMRRMVHGAGLRPAASRESTMVIPAGANRPVLNFIFKPHLESIKALCAAKYKQISSPVGI